MCHASEARKQAVIIRQNHMMAVWKGPTAQTISRGKELTADESIIKTFLPWRSARSTIPSNGSSATIEHVAVLSRASGDLVDNGGTLHSHILRVREVWIAPPFMAECCFIRFGYVHI